MDCPKCHSQDTEYKSGMSKKTGKKWQGYKCVPCDVMIGMNGMVWGDTPKSPNGNPPQSNSLEKKVDEILAILKANFKQGTTIEKDEAPF